ncbi:beta-ketoacyl synthase N-terminal-like domain-containing protein [Undibacterium sp. Ji67W]|uniref:beta-ketoacyl synthase N-terminal-like domain-containing protein n=1 Tax=Undibacterium sp. Ji67W TaxID=3413042 RepID=UPI003BF2146A
MSGKILSPHAIVISGIGICTPLGRDEESFTNAVLSGSNCFSHASSFDGSQLVSDLVSEFAPNDTEFGLSHETLHMADRGAWFALACVRDAVAAAKLDLKQVSPERLTVVVGTSHSGIQHIEKIFKKILTKRMKLIFPHEVWAALTDHAAILVCRELQSLGSRVTVSSACASSNTALGMAYDLLRQDRADLVVVVGTDTISESIVAGFNCLRAMSQQPAAPFSTPSGISLGEGAGAVVLERLSQAQQRGVVPRAELLGYALSGDAYHETATDLEGRGIEAAVYGALANAGLHPSDIDYVSAHGTGTDANDIPESLATARIFGDGISTSSPKSFLGHTLGASGILELLLTVLLAERGMLPPTLNFKGTRPGRADLDYIPNAARPGKCETFICNNYGFGGNNSSIVVSRSIGKYTPQLSQRRRAVLSGYGLHLPGGVTRANWLTYILSGKTTAIWDDKSACKVAKIEPLPFTGKLRPFARSSPMIKFAIKAVDELIESTDLYDTLLDDPLENGLIGGVTYSAHRSLEKFMESVFVDGAAFASATHFPMTTMNAAAGQVSIAYGIKGFNTTMCGSAAAIDYALRLVEFGRQQRVITFGADELTPDLISLGCVLGLQATESDNGLQCGYAFAEGAVALLFEQETSASANGRRILAEVAGHALTQDGAGYSTPSEGEGIARAIRLALKEANLDVNSIHSICIAHEGNTLRWFAQEKAISTVFGGFSPQRLDPTPTYGHAFSALLPMLFALAAEAVLGNVPTVEKGQASLVVYTSVGGDHFAAVVVPA